MDHRRTPTSREWRISKNIMDSSEGSSNEYYLYGGHLQGDNFVSPVKGDNESSVDIYDGLDTDYQGGGQSSLCDVSGKNKPAQDCFDLYEEILTEERTAKEISLKEFQEKSVERERKLEELLKKLHEVETKNSTLSNENIQLKKNISALIKTARQEIIRKDEEINRLNRRQSMNWMGNSCLRRHTSQYTHPPGSLNVPNISQNDNTRRNLPCPSRSSNIEQRLHASHLNEEASCPQDGPNDCRNNILKPKSQSTFLRNHKSLSSSHSLLDRKHSSKSSLNSSTVPPHYSNMFEDKAEPFPCKDRRGIEKLNGHDLVRHGIAEKLYSSTDELAGPRNKNKELDFPEKVAKLGQTTQKARPHSKTRSTAQHTPERRSNKNSQHVSQGTTMVLSRSSADSKESKSHVEKEEKRKETKKSDPRSREQIMNRERELGNNRENPKDKQKDDRLRSKSFPNERKSERRHSEKRSDSLKSSSPCKSSRRSTGNTSDHSSRERRHQKVESKSVGKERSTEDSRERRSKQSNKNAQGEDSVRQSDKHDNRSLKDDSKKGKSKSEHKENQSDHRINRHLLPIGRDCIDKEHQNEKDKIRLPEGKERMRKGHSTEGSLHGCGVNNVQSTTNEQSSVRDTDPKLHFMETLQLTVSPVKKISAAPCKGKMPCTRILSEDEMMDHDGRLASASEKNDFGIKRHPNEASEIQGNGTEMELEESGVSVLPVDLEPEDHDLVASALLKGGEVEEGFEVLFVEESDPVQLNEIVLETVETVVTVCDVVESSMLPMETKAGECLQSVEKTSEVDKNVDALSKISQQIMEVDCPVDEQCQVSGCATETDNTVSSEKVPSLTETGNPGNSGLSLDVATIVIERQYANSEADATCCELQQIIGSVVDSSAVTTPVKTCLFDDPEEDSIQSIDFTYIGCIGAPISPLTSPLRPIRSSTSEKSDTPSDRNVELKDSEVKVQDGCSLSSCTMDLNKENQEPLYKPGVKALDISEEIEEGEIVTDVDECTSQVQKLSCNVQVKESNNKENGNSGQNPSEKKGRLANPDESAVKYSSEVLPKFKPVKNQGESKGVPSNQNTEGLKRSSLSSVERYQIKSSVTDLMETLMVARKIIRRKYMKLHKQFEIRSFKRIIEIATAEFISVVKRYKFPKSRQKQKSSICAMIETTLLQIKCNGIVNNIFSQQAPNMKEKLWTFVEKQFDFMFEKTREIFISCENTSMELALEEERKNEKKLIKSKQRNAVVKHKDAKLSKLKRSYSLEPSVANNVLGKKNSEKKLATERSNQKGTTLNNHAKNCIELSASGITKENYKPSTKVKNLLPVNQMNLNASNDSLLNSNSIKDSHEKTELGILTEQQASTLTFNLVSDAQMGEIFKCLLQGSDLLEQGISTLECNSWPVPEKMHPDVSTHLSSTSEKAVVVSQGDSISWPITPNKHSVGLRPPLNIDILDESCMLEVPDKVVLNRDACATSPSVDSSSLKVIETSSVLQMRPSTILMEDLAVSLTVPSPLKSDGEISFLTSQNGSSLTGEVSETILSGHYNENTVLDEEDASEQDIHLALDSDNSSSRSSSSSTWSKQMSASIFPYHCHPPMQAVVMEKSNDHFIVKIRCRASNTDSPLQSSLSAVNESSNLVPVKQTILSSNNVQDLAEEQDCVMSEALPDHSQIVDHPFGESRGMEETGMEVDRQPPHLEKDQLSLTKMCADHETLNTQDMALLTPTNLDPSPSSGNAKRKCNTKMDSTEKRARKDPETSKNSKKKDDGKTTTRKKSSSSTKSLKKAVTPEKTMTNTNLTTVLSPTCLPAKNVIKKNGEVVFTWTREDDRLILLDCQQKGANDETFSYISRKLDRSPHQVSERFHCLMKLFKRTENKNN
ncbi:CASP8-associated protein 2 isoform X2 [Narcine bancroftii]|uniref:CASP8-associated protein 2 isoform X2 n=1 Tax=Narcine bancroftii TaxID=1343680 RepID=UPI003831F769